MWDRFTDTFLLPAEHAVNTALRVQPRALVLLEPLAGKAILIELDGLPPVIAVFRTTGIALRFPSETTSGEVDAGVSGTWSDLSALLSRDKGAARQFRVRGDVHAVNHLWRLLESLWPDLSGPLAATVEAGRCVGEGWRVLPPPEQVAAFVDGVDRLRADADRLEARIRRLERGAA